MLVLAYPLTFTVRAYAITGRDTRVHAAGVLGAGLFYGSIMIAGLILAKRRPFRLGVAVLIAVWAGMMTGFGLDVQRDYVRAWDLQQAFWARLVTLLPDVTDGTVVLVDPDVLEDTRQIGANYWNMPPRPGEALLFPHQLEGHSQSVPNGAGVEGEGPYGGRVAAAGRVDHILPSVDVRRVRSGKHDPHRCGPCRLGETGQIHRGRNTFRAPQAHRGDRRAALPEGLSVFAHD